MVYLLQNPYLSCKIKCFEALDLIPSRDSFLLMLSKSLCFVTHDLVFANQGQHPRFKRTGAQILLNQGQKGFVVYQNTSNFPRIYFKYTYNQKKKGSNTPTKSILLLPGPVEIHLTQSMINDCEAKAKAYKS